MLPRFTFKLISHNKTDNVSKYKLDQIQASGCWLVMVHCYLLQKIVTALQETIHHLNSFIITGYRDGKFPLSEHPAVPFWLQFLTDYFVMDGEAQPRPHSFVVLNRNQWFKLSLGINGCNSTDFSHVRAACIKVEFGPISSQNNMTYSVTQPRQ